MGTRHMVIVRANGKEVLAEYGQWDGYPAVGGLQVLADLRKIMKGPALRALFEQNLFALERAGAKDVVHYEGHNVLGYILAGNKHIAYLYPFFNDAAMLIEWMYVIDLDTDTLTVYEAPGTWLFPARSELFEYGLSITTIPPGLLTQSFHADSSYRGMFPCVSMSLGNLPSDDQFISAIYW